MSKKNGTLVWIVALCLAGVVQAAEVTLGKYEDNYEDGPGAFIVVSGETLHGDYKRFVEKLPEAIAIHGSKKFPIDVWLDGPGGDLREAIKLGQLIYDLGFVTGVGEGAECASACALIWLGGGDLLMRPGAKIGFHQAYVGDGAASVSGNARVGHYLSRVGLEASVVEYVMSADPDELRWLDPDLANAIGLPVSIWDQ